MPSITCTTPNLFLVGSMKCGTTSLHNYLAAHPRIFMTREPWKEPAYFVEELNWSRGERWYADLFQGSAGFAYRGESSTDYTKFPHYRGVAAKIAQSCADARILYLIRDPIERSISHYWWEVQYSAEGRDMPMAVRKNRIIRDVSHYAMQLKEFLPLFGRDRMCVVTTEELSANPAQVVEEIFRWLGVDAAHVPENLGKRHNVSPEYVRKVIGSEVFSHLHGGLLWKAAKRVIPRNIRSTAIRALSRTVPRDDRGVAETIRYLRPIQREQTAELCELLGRQFPQWTTLYGEEPE